MARWSVTRSGRAAAVSRTPTPIRMPSCELVSPGSRGRRTIPGSATAESPATSIRIMAGRPSYPGRPDAPCRRSWIMPAARTTQGSGFDARIHGTNMGAPKSATTSGQSSRPLRSSIASACWSMKASRSTPLPMRSHAGASRVATPSRRPAPKAPLRPELWRRRSAVGRSRGVLTGTCVGNPYTVSHSSELTD